MILCSQTGTTAETVRAASHARGKGSRTIGMTLDPASPLAQGVDATVRYQSHYATGVPIDAADSNYGVLFMLLASLVRLTDGEDRVPAALASLNALQPAIDRAHERYAPLFADFAPRFARKNAIYTMASGACYGAAYSFAICVLMEMLWIHSQAVHADEFFHGPFEIVDREAAFVQLIGLGETRRLDLRARSFLDRFGAPQNILAPRRARSRPVGRRGGVPALSDATYLLRRAVEIRLSSRRAARSRDARRPPLHEEDQRLLSAQAPISRAPPSHSMIEPVTNGVART